MDLENFDDHLIKNGIPFAKNPRRLIKLKFDFYLVLVFLNFFCSLIRIFFYQGICLNSCNYHFHKHDKFPKMPVHQEKYNYALVVDKFLKLIHAVNKHF